MTPNNRKGPDDMEIDALTKRGESHKGKGKSKTDRQRQRQRQEQRERSHNSDRVDGDHVGRDHGQISRITRDDTWNRPVPMDEDEDEEYEAGYVLATIRHREPFHHS